MPLKWERDIVGTWELVLSDCFVEVRTTSSGKWWIWEIREKGSRRLITFSGRYGGRWCWPSATRAKMAACRRVRGGRPWHAAAMVELLRELSEELRAEGK